MIRFPDLTGQTFGRLTVLHNQKIENGRNAWMCKCICGKNKLVANHHLKRLKVQSCGCLRKESAHGNHLTHGMTIGKIIPPEYHSWASMKKRCLNPKCKNFDDYGGRGIKICKRWMTFIKFFQDMGKRPTLKHCLERIDNNGNYEPGNCRWATWKEQCNNRRTSHFISYQGKTLTIAGWSDITGLGQHIILKRIRRGWTVEKSLTITSRSNGYRPIEI